MVGLCGWSCTVPGAGPLVRRVVRSELGVDRYRDRVMAGCGGLGRGVMKGCWCDTLRLMYSGESVGVRERESDEGGRQAAGARCWERWGDSTPLYRAFVWATTKEGGSMADAAGGTRLVPTCDGPLRYSGLMRG